MERRGPGRRRFGQERTAGTLCPENRENDRDIERKLAEHEIGTLLTTIDGIGSKTAALLVSAQAGNPDALYVQRIIHRYPRLAPRMEVPRSDRRNACRKSLHFLTAAG